MKSQFSFLKNPTFSFLRKKDQHFSHQMDTLMLCSNLVHRRQASIKFSDQDNLLFETKLKIKTIGITDSKDELCFTGSVSTSDSEGPEIKGILYFSDGLKTGWIKKIE